MLTEAGIFNGTPIIENLWMSLSSVFVLFCFVLFLSFFVLMSNVKLTLKSTEVKINIIVFMYMFSLGNLNYQKQLPCPFAILVN